VDAAQTRVELNGQTVAVGDDYIPSSVAGNVSGQVVFAANGWFIKSKKIGRLTGTLMPKAKIAVVFVTPNSLPHGFRFSELEGKQGEDWMNAVDYARKQGVARSCLRYRLSIPGELGSQSTTDHGTRRHRR